MPTPTLSLQNVTPSLLMQSAGIAAYRKGMAYHLNHQVKIESINATHATARVQGTASQPYRVDLDRGASGQIEFTCDCAVFDGYAPCKHVVAAILEMRAADREGHARSSPWESTRFRVRRWMRSKLA